MRGLHYNLIRRPLAVRRGHKRCGSWRALLSAPARPIPQLAMLRLPGFTEPPVLQHYSLVAIKLPRFLYRMFRLSEYSAALASLLSPQEQVHSISATTAQLQRRECTSTKMVARHGLA